MAEWIKIAPRGPTTTRTRKPYAFDPEALAARFNADDVKVPIDFDHGIVRLGQRPAGRRCRLYRGDGARHRG